MTLRSQFCVQSSRISDALVLRCRTIQDCIAWSLQYLHQCVASKRPIVVVKLNFEEVFDIQNDGILEIMKFKGFNVRWRSRVTELLSSGVFVDVAESCSVKTIYFAIMVFDKKI